MQAYTGLEIAVIGMACRFPMAANHTEYWENLAQGKEAVKFYTDEELKDLQIPEEQLKNPAFVKAGIRLENKQYFDSAFFDYRPDEAELMNPDLRLFHECVWEALEDAGCNPEHTEGLIGLYAGATDDMNWKMYSLIQNMDEKIDIFTLSQINSKDHLASMVSYKLNLKGPAYSLYTACSTSLVSVHLACRSLLLGETAIAIAGGAAVRTHPEYGYFYKEGNIHSKDGHCRAFDKSASGTIGGEGVGVVVLKRLKDALAANDHIYAVIKGSAINNDGSRKVGYTAPSVEGQFNCIRMAHKFGRTEPSSVSYVETHGTGTLLGDPIEIAALNKAFDHNSSDTCFIGSVKTNIGHADTAAGIAGFIKTVLSLKNRMLPPSLNYVEQNPKIEFEKGPFKVNAELKGWPANKLPLRAGVSSFGIGGTNAHIVLEEAPVKKVSSERPVNLLTLSAKTESALINYIKRLSDFIDKQGDELSLSDMAFTFQTGRRHFPYRQAFCFSSRMELLKLLNSETNDIVKSHSKNLKIVFMFSGTGSQYVNMGRTIYEKDTYFRKEMDSAFDSLLKLTSVDYKKVLFTDNSEDVRVNDLIHSQPLIFVFGYCLARKMMSLGIQPAYMVGHSLGEYIAACIAGVFSFDDALLLVVTRARLMDTLPDGLMVSVPLSKQKALAYANSEVSIAAINGPGQVVFSGVVGAIEQLITKLDKDGVSYIRLFVSRPAHSASIDSIADQYRQLFGKITMSSPTIPFASNLSGHFITDEEAVSADYWVNHMRETVQFSSNLKVIQETQQNLVFIEIGGGHSLTGLLRQQYFNETGLPALSMIRHAKDQVDDLAHFTNQLGKLWMLGVPVNWGNLGGTNEVRNKMSMPTYVFDRKAYPVEVDSYGMLAKKRSMDNREPENSKNKFFYTAQWKQSAYLPRQMAKFTEDVVILFSSDCEVCHQLIKHFNGKGVYLIVVEKGNAFGKTNGVYQLNPCSEEDYAMLFAGVIKPGINSVRILHLWNYEENRIDVQKSSENINYYKSIGYDSMLFIARQIAKFSSISDIQLDVIANGIFNMLGTEYLQPSKSLMLAPIKVIPLEFDNINCRILDIDSAKTSAFEIVIKEIYSPVNEKEICLRGERRFIKDFVSLSCNADEVGFSPEKGSTYLITGANGGLAKLLSHYLVDNFQAKLILVGRQQIPPTFVSLLTDKGADICYVNTDITRFDEMFAGIRSAEAKMGVVKGVIHTAGQVDVGGMILRRSQESDSAVFSPKVKGTACLFSYFEDRKLDFFVNCSALAATIPPLGQVAYAAANLYLDTFAERYGKYYPIVSIEWCILNGVGMAEEIADREQKDSIKPTEITFALLQSIANRIPVQLISPIDINTAIKTNWQHFKGGIARDLEIKLKEKFGHERPELSNGVKEPSTELERKVAMIWKDFFGYSVIGVEDNFFELGGDSLRALVLSKRMQRDLNIELSLSDFFQVPTIRGIVGKIKQAIVRDEKDKKSIVI